MCYHQPSHKNTVNPAAQFHIDDLLHDKFDLVSEEEPEMYEQMERELLRLYNENQP
jgi:hypothetical protein